MGNCLLTSFYMYIHLSDETFIYFRDLYNSEKSYKQPLTTNDSF